MTAAWRGVKGGGSWQHGRGFCGVAADGAKECDVGEEGQVGASCQNCAGEVFLAQDEKGRQRAVLRKGDFEGHGDRQVGRTGLNDMETGHRVATTEKESA